MGYLAKENTLLAVETEDTEGVYKSPLSGASYLSPLSDGLEMNGAKELKERNILTGSIGSVTPRVGQRSITGSIGLELKANGSSGVVPEFDSLLLSCLGAKRQSTSVITTSTGHTSSVVQIEDADIANFKIGDIVLLKESGAFHVSPIIAVDETIGAAFIELLVAGASAFSDNVDIEKFTTYVVANDGHPTISLTKYLESKIVERGIGCRVTSLALNNFTTGSIADLSFGIDGIDYEQALEVPAHTPTFDAALPPLVLSACVYQDGVKIPVNDLTLSLENTIGWITSTCSESGRISSRITKRSVSGTINPYKDDDNVDNYTRFRNQVAFSLFFSAHNPTGVDGEFKDVVAGYLPNCIITELPQGDKDGVITEDVAFSADRGTAGDKDEMFLSFI